MARMVPEKLSNSIRNNSKKQGEVKIYDCLQMLLGNDWTVYYSVAWLGKVFSSSDRRDGEIDFIIANPKHGIIIAEVKGGQKIEYDGNTGNWYSTNKRGDKNLIKDAYNQAKENKYSLINEIKSWRGWETGLGNVNMCHIAIFPDVSEVSGKLPLHAKKEITVLEDDMANISKKLIEAIEYSCNHYKTDVDRTRKMINDINTNIAPPLVIRRKLSNSIAEDESAIVTLTENQYFLLRTLQGIRRASISGCAGSGKTLLAMKKAQMSNSSGYKTLLCCYNALLGEEFVEFASQEGDIIGGSFHSIMYSILSNSFNINRSKILNIIYDDNKLLEVFLSNRPPQFDVVILDETQDFSTSQLEIIDLMLTKGGVFYCFWDNNQRLLRADFKLPKELQEFNLDINLRNTKKIFDKVKRYYYQNVPIFNNGPEGQDVKLCSPYNPLRSKELKQKLTNEILNLINKESIKPENIAVLTFKSKENSALNEFSIPGLNISVFDNERRKGEVIIDTVRRFKGLESPVVILTEFDDYNAINDNELWENLCYVGISRARNYLSILPSTNVLKKLEQRFNEVSESPSEMYAITK